MNTEDTAASLLALWTDRLACVLRERLSDELATPFAHALIESGRDATVAIELARDTAEPRRTTALLDCAEALWRIRDRRALKIAREALRACDETASFECLRVVQSFGAIEDVVAPALAKVRPWTVARRNIDGLVWATTTRLRLVADGYGNASAARTADASADEPLPRIETTLVAIDAKALFDTAAIGRAALYAELSRVCAKRGDTESALAHFETAHAQLASQKQGVEITVDSELRARGVAYACALRSLIDAASALGDASVSDRCASVFVPVHCGSLAPVNRRVLELALNSAQTSAHAAFHCWIDAHRECEDEAIRERLRSMAQPQFTAELVEEQYADGLITTAERRDAVTALARIAALDGRTDEARSMVDAFERAARASLVADLEPIRASIEAALATRAVSLAPLVAAKHASLLDEAVLAERREQWKSLARNTGTPSEEARAAIQCVLALLYNATAIALRGDRTRACELLDEVAPALADVHDRRSRLTRPAKFAVALVAASIATGRLDQAIAASSELAYARDGMSVVANLIDALVREGRRDDAVRCTKAALGECTTVRALAHVLPAVFVLARDEEALVHCATIANESVGEREAWARGAPA